ncbi:hypothetical protein P8825_14995 [Shouchella clausii]|uniref:hypothetical protein n=1 Tax=Shouchella clausii TaxID=79880 RepID=UPI002DBEAE35|nr:hypothetical protein [Shouchella clausii]MEB5480871.1 hypothetical protein [Shouchella clausii]
MGYKYKDVEEVVAKRDFEVIEHNEHGEVDRVITVPEGCKGVIEAMGWSNTDNFRNSYDIRFLEEDNEICVSIHEEDMELLLEIVDSTA